ncbi:hypothetical protein KL921_000111 [Ogataea angusta]|nr:hypothetical protein KL921_000111 [Ogataea angusta]
MAPSAWVIVTCASIASLNCGTLYFFGAYSPQVASQLRYTAAQTSRIAIAGQSATVLAGPPCGHVIDAVGFTVPVVLGTLAIWLGYFLFYKQYSSAASNVPYSCFLFALIGVGSTGLSSACVKSSMLAWPARKGLAVALPLACYGASGIFFSRLGSWFTPGDTAEFLKMVASVTFGIGLRGGGHRDAGAVVAAACAAPHREATRTLYSRVLDGHSSAGAACRDRADVHLRSRHDCVLAVRVAVADAADSRRIRCGGAGAPARAGESALAVLDGRAPAGRAGGGRVPRARAAVANVPAARSRHADRRSPGWWHFFAKPACALFFVCGAGAGVRLAVHADTAGGERPVGDDKLQHELGAVQPDSGGD